jgi:hypothetical protein
VSLIVEEILDVAEEFAMNGFRTLASRPSETPV